MEILPLLLMKLTLSDELTQAENYTHAASHRQPWAAQACSWKHFGKEEWTRMCVSC